MGLLFLILLMPECQFLRSLQHSHLIYNLSISFQFLSIYLPNLDETFFYRLGSGGLGLALGQGSSARFRGLVLFLCGVGKGWGEKEG